MVFVFEIYFKRCGYLIIEKLQNNSEIDVRIPVIVLQFWKLRPRRLVVFTVSPYQYEI